MGWDGMGWADSALLLLFARSLARSLSFSHRQAGRQAGTMFTVHSLQGNGEDGMGEEREGTDYGSGKGREGRKGWARAGGQSGISTGFIYTTSAVRPSVSVSFSPFSIWSVRARDTNRLLDDAGKTSTPRFLSTWRSSIPLHMLEGGSVSSRPESPL